MYYYYFFHYFKCKKEFTSNYYNLLFLPLDGEFWQPPHLVSLITH